MVTVLDDLKSDRNLLSATIEITYRCNFKCNYCFQKSLRKSYGKELDISDWKKILDILADNGCIRLVFTGGEICMKKDMDKIYKYAYDKGFIIDVASNCFAIEKVPLFNSIIENRPNRFVVTLYGDNGVYHNFCFVENGWKTVKKNIVTLLEHGIKVHARCVFHKYNFDSVDKIRAFVNEYDIPVSIYTTVISDCNYEVRYDNMNLKTEKILKIYEKFNKIKEIKDLLLSFKKNETKCGAGNNSLYINPYGFVYLCPALLNKSSLFNILETGFDLCWELLYKERKRHIELYTPCRDCQNVNFCSKCYPNYSKEYCENIDILEKIVCSRTRLIRNKFFGEIL